MRVRYGLRILFVVPFVHAKKLLNIHCITAYAEFSPKRFNICVILVTPADVFLATLAMPAVAARLLVRSIIFFH